MAGERSVTETDTLRSEGGGWKSALQGNSLAAYPMHHVRKMESGKGKMEKGRKEKREQENREKGEKSLP